MPDWDALRAGLAAELGEAITVDALTGDWRIVQRAAGHRHSIDDVLTAAYALRHGSGSPPVRRALDLGTGIGTVGLLVLSGLPADATLVAVEAQAISHRLLLANIAGNGLGARVTPHHADLRELGGAARTRERFALVTGSPPYFPLGTGVLPADSQKAHARFELRGDVADYCRAAVRWLTSDGVFVFCFPTPQRARALAAVTAAGLVTRCYQDVIPRVGRASLFTLFATGMPSGPATVPPLPPLVEAPFEVRDATGRMTPAILAVRRGFGHFSVERDPEPV